MKAADFLYPGLFICLAVSAAAGWGLPDGYWGLLFLTALSQASLVLSYNIPGGYGGELHLGHGVFFGLGAYVSAYVVIQGVGWWGGLAAAGLSGFLLALPLWFLLAPITGIAYALCSMAFLLVGGLLATNLEWLTGGSAGLSLNPVWDVHEAVLGAACLLAFTGWMHDRYADSRFGRALRAAADDPEAAMAMGIPVNKIRGRALVLGGVPAALAGGMYPFYFAYISPQSAFGLETALAPVVMVLCGGPGTRFGPILGMVVLTAAQEFLWTHGWQWSLTLWGGLLMVIGLFMPKGIAGVLKR